MRKALLRGNWKMNGNLAENAERLNILSASCKTIENIELVVCPPSLFIKQVRK